MEWLGFARDRREIPRLRGPTPSQERRRKKQSVGFARNDKFCRVLWDINLVVITFKP